MGRRSSDEDDDEDDASCEWFSGFSVGERDRVRRSRTDRPASVYSFLHASSTSSSTVEDRLGIPRICAHSGRTTCSELAQILYTQRDSKTKIYLVVRVPGCRLVLLYLLSGAPGRGPRGGSVYSVADHESRDVRTFSCLANWKLNHLSALILAFTTITFCTSLLAKVVLHTARRMAEGGRRRRRARISGYDTDLSIEPVREDLTCIICSGIHRDPMMVNPEKCGHTYCRGCIEQYLR